MLAKRGIEGKGGECPTAAVDDDMGKISIHYGQSYGEGTLLVEVDYYNADFTFSNRSTKTSHVWRKLNGGQFSCDVIMETRLCSR